jgi:hypothetical protein
VLHSGELSELLRQGTTFRFCLTLLRRDKYNGENGLGCHACPCFTVPSAVAESGLSWREFCLSAAEVFRRAASAFRRNAFVVAASDWLVEAHFHERDGQRSRIFVGLWPTLDAGTADDVSAFLKSISRCVRLELRSQ